MQRALMRSRGLLMSGTSFAVGPQNAAAALAAWPLQQRSRAAPSIGPLTAPTRHVAAASGRGSSWSGSRDNGPRSGGGGGGRGRGAGLVDRPGSGRGGARGGRGGGGSGRGGGGGAEREQQRFSLFPSSDEPSRSSGGGGGGGSAWRERTREPRESRGGDSWGAPRDRRSGGDGSGYSGARRGGERSERGGWESSRRSDGYGSGDDGEGWDGDGEESWDGDFQYPARPSKSALREQLFGDVLYGVAPVLAALRTRRRTPHVLYVQEGASTAKRKDGRAFQECLDLARESGVAVRPASKHDMNMLADNRPHQGLLLDCSGLEWDLLDQLPSADEIAAESRGGDAEEGEEGEEGEGGGGRLQQRHPVWLALDEVTDPQNLGAMLRSAHCLGATGVLATAKNCAPLSAVVSKASAGALEVMSLHSTRNLPQTLADAAGRGWAVVGAAADRGATPLTQFVVDRPTVLVMGNEGHGLRTNVRRACTDMVKIEMASQAPRTAGGSGMSDWGVDSLNVSVAAGILLHHFVSAAATEGAGGAEE